jgi:hypothetical protein
MDKRCFPLRGRASEGRVAGLRGWHGGLRRQPCAKRAARAGAEAPDLVGARSRAAPGGRGESNHNATGVFAGQSGAQPSGCQLSLQGTKSFTLPSRQGHRFPLGQSRLEA